jgi:hypothetical protein
VAVVAGCVGFAAAKATVSSGRWSVVSDRKLEAVGSRVEVRKSWSEEKRFEGLEIE